MWQDYSITIVVLVFNLTIIPMIRSEVALPLWTTLPMTVGAAVLAATYATLGLWFSVGIETMAFLGWAILLQRTFKHV